MFDQMYHMKSRSAVVPAGIFRVPRLPAIIGYFSEPQISTSKDAFMTTDRPPIHRKCGWSVSR